MINFKKLSFQIPMAIVCFLLAFFITWQLKSVRKSELISTTSQANRLENVQNELRKEKEKNEALMQEKIDLRDDLQKFKDAAAKDSGTTKILTEQLAKAEMLAGLTDVEGPGIVITLNDNAAKAMDPTVTNRSLYYIHDEDILRVINELRASGAEAISLNDERILSTSEIRCTGPTVSVNKTPYAAPFKIKAIGNPETLENALKMPDGVRDLFVNLYQLEFTIQKQNKLEIKQFSGVYTGKFASTVKKEGE